MNDFLITKFRCTLRGEEIEKPLLRFYWNGKNILILEEDVLYIPYFGCIVNYSVLVFILIYFTVFCTFAFSNLLCGICLQKFTTFDILALLKVKIFADKNLEEFTFATHDPTHRNLFRKNFKSMRYFQKTLRFWKKKIQKIDMRH